MKSKEFNLSSNKSKLDQFLWGIGNYLAHKRDRGYRKKVFLNNLDYETTNRFLKLTTKLSKILFPIKRIGHYLLILIIGFHLS